MGTIMGMVKIRSLIAAGLLGAAALAVDAAQVTYQVIPLGGNTWQYNYVATNDSLSSLDEFTVWFDQSLYSSLSLVASPANWDPLIVQPDLGIPADGFFDALALSGGIALGSSLSGFSVSFDYLGANIPGSQSFGVFDPATFELLDSGQTQLAAVTPPSPVPEPGSFALVGMGFAGLFLSRRRLRQLP